MMWIFGAAFSVDVVSALAGIGTSDRPRRNEAERATPHSSFSTFRGGRARFEIGPSCGQVTGTRLPRSRARDMASRY